MRTNIYNQIINLLPSFLRDKIAECGYTVPEIDLLRIVYLHAGSFAEQLQFFHILQEEGSTEDVRGNAKLMQEHLTQGFSDFESDAANCVYELCIKDTPDSYEEKYLCATLKDALRAISLYYELYREIAKENDKSRYRVVKRRIFNSSEPFDEDAVGECEYRAGGVLYRVIGNHAVVCDEDSSCKDCEKICVSRIEASPSLPKYLKDGDIVTFCENGKKCYGYNIDLDLYDHTVLPKDTSFASEY